MANLIFRNIPNILTTIRIIILIPILVLFYFSLSDQKTIYQIHFFNLATLKINLYFLIIGILFVVASFSDFLDGYLARKYQLISNYGKVFDPIADKLLINAVLIYFAYLGVVNFYLVILLILRDIYVDGLRVFVSTKKIVVPANIFGKLKTVAQMVAIIITFFVAGQFVLTNTIANQIFNLAYYLATFFSLSSGGIYSYQIYQKYQMMVKQTNTEQTPTS